MSASFKTEKELSYALDLALIQAKFGEPNLLFDELRRRGHHALLNYKLALPLWGVRGFYNFFLLVSKFENLTFCSVGGGGGG